MVEKTNNRLRKIRIIVQSENITPVFGVVLPAAIGKKWFDVFVRVKESGNCIILESGALPIPFSRTNIRQTSKRLNVVEI